MGAERFGDLLGRIVPLSEHDVAEILDAQAVSRRRFGEIALGWGLCQPEHVWQAWLVQLARRTEIVDLRQIGIDTQALRHVPVAIAREFGVVPLRTLGLELVLATSPRHHARAQSELPALLQRELRFVLCDEDQLAAALDSHYRQDSPRGDSPPRHGLRP